MSFHTPYASVATTINYAGVILETGKGDDVWLNVSYNSPRASFRKGADGNTSASISPDRSGTVTLTYFAESNSAKILQGIYTGLQELDGLAVLGAVPLAVSDPSGAIIFGAKEAVLMEIGDAGYSSDTPTVDYTFYVEDLTVVNLPPELAAQVDAAVNTLSVGSV
jgi:hypothetical protein